MSVHRGTRARGLARLDSAGDVLLTWPAERAVAAQLLPGVRRVLEFRAGWVDFDAPPVDAESIAELVKLVETQQPDEVIIFTSFHQSPLPLALVLRMAGVARISAISPDYPGSLLDVRHHVDDDVPAIRALSLPEAAGYPSLGHRLRVRTDLPDVSASSREMPRRPRWPRRSPRRRACPGGRCSSAWWGPPPEPAHIALWAGHIGDPHATEPDPGLLRIGTDQVIAAATRQLRCFGSDSGGIAPSFHSRTDSTERGETMSQKVNPIQVHKYLSGVDYPCDRRDIVRAARKNGAGAEIVDALESMPDRMFDGPNAVSEAMS
nr:DUF2795 domain-containing protein [Nocardia nova]